MVVPVRELIAAIGDEGDAGAHALLGIVQQRASGGDHFVDAILAAQALHAQHAEPVRRHLRHEVRKPFLGHLAVEQDQLPHVFLQLSGPIEPHGRNAQPFLEDVGVATILEVRMMRGVDGPADQLVTEEDRLGENDVGQVRAAPLIGVVADEHVTRPEPVELVPLQDARHDADEAAQMDRRMRRLAERIPIDIEQRARAVAPFFDVGGVAGSHQRLTHLVGDRREGAAQHLDGDRVQPAGRANGGAGGHPATSMIRLRKESMWTRAPAGSTMAGPAKLLPGRSRSRS